MSRLPKESWRQEIDQGVRLLDPISLSRIDNFAASVVEQLETQLPKGVRVEALEHGLILRISKGSRRVDLNIGAVLTNEWLPLPDTFRQRIEGTLLSILNEIGQLFVDPRGPAAVGWDVEGYLDEVAGYLNGLHTHDDGDVVHGGLDWDEYDLHLTVSVHHPVD